MPSSGSRTSGDTIAYPLIDDLPALVWAANLAALALHVSQWTVTDGGARNPPDRLVVDLGPGLSLVDRTALVADQKLLDQRHQLLTLTGGRKIIVRVDRMELSKNILRGLAAYRELLEREPCWRGRVVHLVFAYPSREAVPEYQAYAADVSRMVADINTQYGDRDWTPVHLETGDDAARSLAAMAIADVLVVNPLYDGQNLVAKEAPVVNDKDAVLILSRNAGAADDLADGALLVHPFDTAELSDAMALALRMPPEERAGRAHKLKAAAALSPPREWFTRQRSDLAAARART